MATLVDVSKIAGKVTESFDPDWAALGTALWESSLFVYTVELQWLEHLWDYENMFETGVVQANEC